MADSKISALPASTTPLAGTEVLPVVQGGVTKQVSVANLTAGRAVATAGGSFTDNITQSTASKGINFTANSAAAGKTSQLFNAYEEGTWTPVADTSGFTTAISALSGAYTKIGRQVAITMKVTLASAGRPTSYSQFSGLPFSASTTSIGVFAGSNVSSGIQGGSVTCASALLYWYATNGAVDSTVWNATVTYFT